MQVKKVFIAGDHASPAVKEEVKKIIANLGYEFEDLGTNDENISVDYPDFAKILADKILVESKNLASANGEQNSEIIDSTKFGIYGILICGTGIGISIAANRHAHIRCALCHDSLTARLCREHNNANVLAFGARVLGIAEIEDMIKTFFSTNFSGGRHERRVNKLGVIACDVSVK
ncbi:MAG: RpiB/LacA/LacB family sugar-phosphate isomerase [Campylobacter sp.]|nr:RpiB/LacA/LacB family sugar-phosphate isomerase [Campylobacter sp.]